MRRIRFNYRHIIWLLLIAGSVALIPFFFRYAHLRIAEACVDLYNSCRFYISELLDLGWTGEITINNFTSQPFELPLNLPRTWEEFKVNLSGYWGLFFSFENFGAYLRKVSDVLFYITKALLIIMPLFLLVFIYFVLKKRKTNNKIGEETKPLRAFKKVEKKIVPPVRN